MAGEEAEKKKIAQLVFDIDTSSLDTINNKLQNLADTSNNLVNKINNNLNTAMKIDASNIIDVNSVKTEMNKVTNISESQAKSLVTNLMKQEQKVTANKKIEQEKRNTIASNTNSKLLISEAKTADKIKVVDAEKNAKIEVAAVKHQNKLEEINERQLKSSKSLYDKITEYAKTYLIYQGFNQLKTVTQEVIDEMVDMEYQMVAIGRVMNESSLDIDNYRDNLVQLAYDYGNSFDNVSDVTLRLAQAGFDSNEALALTERTLLALNTAELDATQATEDMVAVMSQWGLMTGTASEQAESYGEIIDKINKVADNFPTTSEDILNALKRTSSAFNLAGASIDETIAMITAAEVASQRGGKAIGTAMNNITQQLRDAGRLSTMESLGIEVYTDATKTEFKSVIEIISQLSEKMQELKDAGKDNSAEMQNLLEVFTVFRRNIGAGLLSEMSGEDNTYAEALKTSLNSVGYSLQENEKHMATAKAAQAQFNAELLKLKTSVWDGGVEEVFRSMLILGTNSIDGIEKLTDTFGALPFTIGAVTLALTLLSKKMKLASYDAEKGTINIKGFFGSFADIKNNVKEINRLQNSLNGVSNTTKVSFGTMAKNVATYSVKALEAKIQTLALKTATMALNAAASLAASAGVMLLTTAIQEMMNKQAAAIQLQEQAIQSTEEEIEERQENINTLNEMISTYDELAQKEARTPEDVTKLYEIQTEIKNILGEQANTIDLINGKYQDQKKILNDISIEEQRKLVEEKKKVKEQKEAAGVGYELPSAVSRIFGDKDYESVIMQYGGTGLYEGSLKKTLETEDLERLIELFTKWEENLRGMQGESVELANTYNWVTTTLKSLTDNVEESKEATEDYYDELAKLKALEWFPKDRIQNVEDYTKALEAINKIDFSGMDGFKEKLIDAIQNQFPEFVVQAEVAKGSLEDANSVLDTTLTSLQNLADQYAILRNAQDEYNESGQLTISTFQSLIDNNLLQYLSIQNGQLQINAQSMLDLAEAKKVEAIEALQSAAANDIQKAAIGDVETMSDIAKGAVASLGNNAATAGSKAQTAAGQMAILAQSMQDVADAAEGNLGEGVDLSTFQAQANAIMDAYNGIASTISNINITTATYSPQKVSGSSYSGSSSAAEAQAKREAEQAAKEAEELAKELYKNNLAKFEDYVEEKERLEERWVKKQKELGQLSNEDYLYIIQQRINRYKEYLKQVEQMTWLTDEDRIKLEKEYTEEIEDLQVDYLGYLKDILDEEIDALEEANEEKIKMIEDEADARIAALEKVEQSTNRTRDEEDYQKERQAILDEIAYWEQRTGREAAEALKEAKENLEELDSEWQRQLEDWSIEDQIAAIEAERDAEIAAIEASQEAEIKAMQEAYDEKVRLYAETGNLIYEESVIQSSNLYSAYKSNFVDPIVSDLQNIQKEISATTTPTNTTSSSTSSSAKQYETYTIAYGDTLSGIANKFGTTIDKIMEANPYVTNKNKIYAGKTLQIPKFHEGGIVGGTQEAFALLKPNEVILKPEWAEGINKLANLVKNNNTNNIINSGTNIEVKGDLVRIDANIKDKTDAEYLTRKVEKMLKDKFNIKK